MSVVIETTLGDITVDLYLKQRPRASLNFLKLCKMKYYNYNLFHTISRGFIAQTGDPTGTRNGGESIHGLQEGPLKRYFESEKNPRIKHTHNGLVSFVGNEDSMIGSQFFITLGADLTYLDEKHCVFGEVMEGLDVLELLNETICDNDNRPYKDVRITHTVVLDDPFADLKNMRVPSRSPSPNRERLQGGRIGADEEIDDAEGKTAQEISEILAEREAKARATILEMVGDLPDADMAPPENVLFVCKLNPVTTDDDLEIIFSRFGKINSCEVIRDRKTEDSLQYAFVEFAEQKSCEDAYFKMDNVLIDDRRIHVDFSQSVSKIKWHGKGRGVTTYDDKGRKTKDFRNDIGKGKYKIDKNVKREDSVEKEKHGRNGKKYESSRDQRRPRSPENKPYSSQKRNRSPQTRDRIPKYRSTSPKRYNRPRSPRPRDDGHSSKFDYSRSNNRNQHYNYSRNQNRGGRYYEDRRRNNYDNRTSRSYQNEFRDKRNDYPEKRNYRYRPEFSDKRNDYIRNNDRVKISKKTRHTSNSTEDHSSDEERIKTKKTKNVTSGDESSIEEKPTTKNKKSKYDPSSEEETKMKKKSKNTSSDDDSSSEEEVSRKKLKKKKKKRDSSVSSEELRNKKSKKSKKKKKRKDSSSD